MEMTHYSVEPRTRKCVRGYGLLSFARNLSVKYWTKLLDIASKTGLEVAKKVVLKTTEATGELRGGKITEKVVKTKPVVMRILEIFWRNKYSPREKTRDIK